MFLIASYWLGKASERFTSNFPVLSLYFARLVALVASTTTAATFTFKKSELITGQPASKSVVMTKLPGSSRTVVFVLTTKVFANITLEHYSRTMITKTVQNLSQDFPVLAVANTGSCVGPQNNRKRSPCWTQVPVLSARGI